MWLARWLHIDGPRKRKGYRTVHKIWEHFQIFWVSIGDAFASRYTPNCTERLLFEEFISSRASFSQLPFCIMLKIWSLILHPHSSDLDVLRIIGFCFSDFPIVKITVSNHKITNHPHTRSHPLAAIRPSRMFRPSGGVVIKLILWGRIYDQSRHHRTYIMRLLRSFHIHFRVNYRLLAFLQNVFHLFRIRRYLCSLHGFTRFEGKLKGGMHQPMLVCLTSKILKRCKPDCPSSTQR